MSRATACFSIYSDISTRRSAVSSSKINSASALVSSVFPTPVGPRNKKEPIGRLESCSPARERRTALLTATSASSCPTTRFLRLSSICSSLARSPSSILVTGIPVQRDTTEAMSSSITASLSRADLDKVSASCNCLVSFGISPYTSSPALVRSPARCAISRWRCASSICSLIF